MTDTASNYRIWESPESVLIQTPHGALELSIADAIAIAAEITTQFAPTHPYQAPTGRVVRWTQARSDECVRLYTHEGLGGTVIGKCMGVTAKTVRAWLLKAGVQLRSHGDHRLPVARAALAAKRAARRAARRAA